MSRLVNRPACHFGTEIPGLKYAGPKLRGVLDFQLTIITRIPLTGSKDHQPLKRSSYSSNGLGHLKEAEQQVKPHVNR